MASFGRYTDCQFPNSPSLEFDQNSCYIQPIGGRIIRIYKSGVALLVAALSVSFQAHASEQERAKVKNTTTIQTPERDQAARKILKRDVDIAQIPDIFKIRGELSRQTLNHIYPWKVKVEPTVTHVQPDHTEFHYMTVLLSLSESNGAVIAGLLPSLTLEGDEPTAEIAPFEITAELKLATTGTLTHCRFYVNDYAQAWGMYRFKGAFLSASAAPSIYSRCELPPDGAPFSVLVTVTHQNQLKAVGAGVAIYSD